MWCVAELNEEYIAKMEDVLEVYERPYNPKEPVVCLDEKPVTLHADVRPALPAKPGRETRQDNEYERRGTANLFCAVEPKAGRHFTFATPDRSAPEFVKVAVDLALRYPAAKTIHLIVDNLNIHRRKSLTDLLGDEIGAEVWDRFTIHYTPTHGSWLNQAEIENRNGCAPVSRPPPHPRPGHSAPRNPRLESSHESRPRQNQLAIRSPSRQTQVPLRKELFQAVKDLEVSDSVSPTRPGPWESAVSDS